MYYITGDIKTSKIKINGKILSTKHGLAIANLTSEEFGWGYAGDSPALLALAILLTCTTEEDAVRLQKEFGKDYIMKFPKRNFSYKVPVRKWLIKNSAKYELHEEDFTPYIMGSDEDNVGRACGEQCTQATTTDCNCSCGGKNHGTAATVKKTVTPKTKGATKE